MARKNDDGSFCRWCLKRVGDGDSFIAYVEWRRWKLRKKMHNAWAPVILGCIVYLALKWFPLPTSLRSLTFSWAVVWAFWSVSWPFNVNLSTGIIFSAPQVLFFNFRGIVWMRLIRFVLFLCQINRWKCSVSCQHYNSRIVICQLLYNQFRQTYGKISDAVYVM